MELLKDVIIPVGCTIFGAALGSLGSYWFTIRQDRKRAAVERDIKRMDDKLKVCTDLKLFLMEWHNEIAKAITFEESPKKTLDKLACFIERKHFENMLIDKVNELKDEPLCEGLIKKATFFKEGALRGKGDVKRGLEAILQHHGIPGPYGCRNDSIIEEQARSDKRVVLDYLNKLYNEFENELNSVIPSLDDKKHKIEQSL